MSGKERDAFNACIAIVEAARYASHTDLRELIIRMQDLREVRTGSPPPAATGMEAEMSAGPFCDACGARTPHGADICVSVLRQRRADDLAELRAARETIETMKRNGHAVVNTYEATHARTMHELHGLRPKSPDDLRALGWSVAVHNDYRLGGEPHTFWLFTRGEEAIKGEGRTDAEALAVVRARLAERK